MNGKPKKNLSRLASQWSRTLGDSIAMLAGITRGHLEIQRRTLSSLLTAETADPTAWERAQSTLCAVARADLQ